MKSTSHMCSESTHRVDLHLKLAHGLLAEVLQEEPAYDARAEADNERATDTSTPTATSDSLSDHERSPLIQTHHLVPAATSSRFYALLAIAACVFALSVAVNFGLMLGQRHRMTNC